MAPEIPLLDGALPRLLARWPYQGVTHVTRLDVAGIDAPWRFAIAVPACNEEKRIVSCLAAAADSLDVCGLHGGVVLAVNNSVDDTFARAATWLRRRRIPYVLADVRFEPRHAGAGIARRLALDIALELTAPDAVLATSDADSRVDRLWAANSLAELEERGDLVCGQLIPDPLDCGPVFARLHPHAVCEGEYAALQRELAARLDPRSHDPLPLHGTEGGASLSFRRAVYLDVGGMPPLKCAEDRTFVSNADTRGWRVVHSAAVRVVTSFRLCGRARGGMADALAERTSAQDPLCDDVLEPAALAALRFWSRGRLRNSSRSGQLRGDVMSRLRIRIDEDPFAGKEQFGEVWHALEARSPRLARKPLTFNRVRGELPHMRRLVESLRAAPGLAHDPEALSAWISAYDRQKTGGGRPGDRQEPGHV